MTDDMMEIETSSLSTIQILSDIHLEFWPQLESIKDLPRPLNNLPVVAPILALLGDIGIPTLPLYKDFITDVSKKFQLVLIISGNHEYYSGQIEEVDILITNIANSFQNVKYLQRTGFEFNNILFLGTTLWTEIPSSPASVYNEYLRCINDYRQIKFMDSETQKVRHIEPKDTTAMHYRDRDWLQEQLINAGKVGKNVCVLTHHCPIGFNTRCLKMRTEDNILEFLDYTDLREFMGRFNENILVWGFGHTHHSSSQLFGKTQIVSNCLGYVRMGEDDPCFDAKFCVDPLNPPVETKRGHYEEGPTQNSSCVIS